MSFQRRFIRRQTAALRRKFRHRLLTVERARTMHAGLLAEGERRKKRADKDAKRNPLQRVLRAVKSKMGERDA